jgi:hypothetical protein
MTKATREVFPFDGDSGGYGQQGSQEHNRGKWRIHAVNNLFDEFACGHWDAAAMKDRLESVEAEMYKGWSALDMVAAATGMRGGSVVQPQVADFIDHVKKLSHEQERFLTQVARDAGIP